MEYIDYCDGCYWVYRKKMGGGGFARGPVSFETVDTALSYALDLSVDHPILVTRQCAEQIALVCAETDIETDNE